MFKKPTAERAQLIMDMVPEMIAVFSQTESGYNSKISKLGEYMRLKDIFKELGMNVPLIAEIPTINFIVSILALNFVDEFAIVFSSAGRMHISFVGEDSPAVQLTREFGTQCINGKIYVYQKEVTKRDTKRMFASGAKLAYHLNSEECTLFHS